MKREGEEEQGEFRLLNTEQGYMTARFEPEITHTMCFEDRTDRFVDEYRVKESLIGNMTVNCVSRDLNHYDNYVCVPAVCRGILWCM
uniref:Uncharacterized protein n=1 Tax=Parascaris equorum TaxID=6256 RepID=A0A914RZP3_PAREQ